MIHSIKLRNFKQHRDLAVEFESGLNTIQGDNGEGKTTVLKAILFALFGAGAAGTKAHLTTWGESGMQVDMTMTLGEVGKVNIIRSLSKAELWQGETLVASGQEAVTHFVEDHLGMVAKLFKSMQYAEQGDTQLLIKMGASALQRQLELVANVDTVDKVLTLINSDNNRDNGVLEGIGAAADLTEQRAELETLSTQQASVGESVQAASLAVDELTKESRQALDRYDNDVLNLRQIERAASDIKAKTAVYDSTNEQLTTVKASEPPVVDSSSIQQMVEEASTLEKQITADRDAINKYQQAKATYDAQMTERKRVMGWAGTLKEADHLYGLWYEACRKNDAAEADLKAKVEAEKNSVCITCQRPFENHDDLLKIKLASEEAHQLTYQALKAASEEYNNYLKKNGLTTQEKDKLSTTLAYLKAQPTPVAPKAVSVTQEQINANSDRLTDLRKQSIDLQMALRTRLDWEKQVERLTSSLAQLSQDIDTLKEVMKALPRASDESVIASKALLDEAVDKLTKAKTAESEAKEQLASITRRIAGLTDFIAKEEEKQERIYQIQKEVADRTELHKYLRANRAKFMDDSWTALLHYTSYLVNSVTEGHITDLTRSGNGDFYVTEGGIDAPVEEMSGAEKSIIGLCLRIGLAHLFYGDQGFVLLDEATADCTEANSARVAGMLKSLKSQVIMVTHRQADAMNANNSIYIG